MMEMDKEEEDHQIQTQKNRTTTTASGGNFQIGTNVTPSRSSSYSKKPKQQKKLPQRGLGVAELERIRLEGGQQRHKKDSIFLSPPHPPPPPQKQQHQSPSLSPNNNSKFSSYIPPVTNIPNFHHPKQSCSSISVPSLLSPPDLSSAESISRPGTVPLPENGWPGINNEQLRQGDAVPSYKVHKNMISMFDPGLAFRSNFCLPFEPNLIWPQKPHQRYHYSNSHKQVNVSVPNSSPSSSVLNVQMEPPSNQSYYGNYIHLSPEEEKMVGMKRSYPFSLQDAPFPSFNCKFPSSASMRFDESSSSLNSIPAFGNPNLREVPSCSTPSSEPNLKKNNKEDGDFLSLAPPAANFQSLPFRGEMETLTFRSESRGLNKLQQFYNFLPVAKKKPASSSEETSDTKKHSNGDVGESVDLNLKL